MPVLQIYANGTPYQIGLKHGQEARTQVRGTMEFYAGLFKENTEMDWPKVRELALSFEPVMRRKWPEYLDEMRGIAQGAAVDLADIVAVNVRTEINFGLFSDGCTALAWRTAQSSFLAQKWDWMDKQKENLVIMTIEQRDKPTIKMVTEAGIIGKIGLNSAGVGVCLNAIKVKGMDSTRIPCHLGLRLVLESSSREDAVQKLEKYDVASSCHMLVADATGGIGLEWSSLELQKITANSSKQIFHSNHYLANHPGLQDTNWLKDSNFRVARIEELSRMLPEDPTMGRLFDTIFKDERNHPGAICRAQESESGSATLFNIIMDLAARKARVAIGRPVAPDQFLDLAF